MASDVRVQFLDDLSADMSDKTKIMFLRTWKRIEAVESEIGKTLENGFSREDYIALFGKFSSGVVMSFMVYKASVVKYINWLVKHNQLDDNALETLNQIRFEDISFDDRYSREYFKDFNALREAVEDTILIAECADDTRFDTIVASIYLSWFGIKPEDACNIEKNDLTESGVKVNGKEVVIPDSVLDFFKEYAKAEGFQQQARGLITHKYIPSIYLLRTSKADHLDVKTLRTMIARFTNICDGGIKFQLDKIYWSGIYNRAYAYECVNGSLKPFDFKTLEAVFNETYGDKLVANKRLRSYQSYRDFYHKA